MSKLIVLKSNNSAICNKKIDFNTIQFIDILLKHIASAMTVN